MSNAQNQVRETITLISRGVTDRTIGAEVVEMRPNSIIVRLAEPLNRDDQLVYRMVADDGVAVPLLYVVITCTSAGQRRWNAAAALLVLGDEMPTVSAGELKRLRRAVVDSP